MQPRRNSRQAKEKKKKKRKPSATQTKEEAEHAKGNDRDDDEDYIPSEEPSSDGPIVRANQKGAQKSRQGRRSVNCIFMYFPMQIKKLTQYMYILIFL